MEARCTLVFDTTNAALWAEEVAQGVGIPVEVVPAPAESDAKCELALVCGPLLAGRLEKTLQDHGVPYRRFHP